ncbi:MAG: shikimate kinase [Actinobacteria bacterium]|nr:MAG: shikimate kinase [Actinomycetota bacterium]
MNQRPTTNDQRPNIVLIGFMGSGKTVVGKNLSSILSRPFIDTDSLIEQRQAKTITEIFDQDSEAGFRKLEALMVAEVTGKKNQVISVGAGAVLDPKNADNLKKSGILIYLKTDFSTTYDRIKASKNRPLLAASGSRDDMQALFESRRITYESISDYIVGTMNKSPKEVAEEIIEELRSDGKI